MFGVDFKSDEMDDGVENGEGIEDEGDGEVGW